MDTEDMSAPELILIVRSVRDDGYPDDEKLCGRVAFIFDGLIVSGSALGPEFGLDEFGNRYWEADSDVGRHGKFGCVTHWLELPVAMWNTPWNSTMTKSGLPTTANV